MLIKCANDIKVNKIEMYQMTFSYSNMAYARYRLKNIKNGDR